MDRIEAYEDFIEEESTQRMTPLFASLPRFQIKRPPDTTLEEKQRRDTVLRERDVVEKVYEHFKPHLAMGRIWNMVKRKGVKHIYECYNLVRQEPGTKPVGKFINIVEGCKFETKEVS